MSIKNNVIAAVVLSLSAVGLSTGASASGSDLCATTEACIYDGQDYTFQMETKVASAPLTNAASVYNDRTSSWINNTATDGRWYTNINGSGDCRPMAAGTREPALSRFNSGDRLSSWATNGLC